jgi:crossover junction endodeoxyribonuclease RuvC
MMNKFQEALAAPRFIIGIDPGQSGSVVRVGFTGIECRRGFKTLPDIANALKDAISKAHTPVEAVVIENVHAMPGQGVCSMFSFGKSTGVALGAVYTLFGSNVVEVSPQKWQNWFTAELGLEKGAGKFDSREVVKLILPEHEKTLSHRKGLDHNACDAALIAIWFAIVGSLSNSPVSPIKQPPRRSRAKS